MPMVSVARKEKPIQSLKHEVRLNWLWQSTPVDMWLFFATLSLLSIGLVMVFSSSIAFGESLGNPYHYGIRQTLYAAAGGVIAATVFYLPVGLWERMRYLMLFGAFLLLVLVLIPGIGKTINGSTRWIPLGFFNLQASEPARLMLIMYLSAYLVHRQEMILGRLRSFMVPVFVLVLAAFLLLLQPDLGAATVLFATGFLMIFLSGGRLLWIIVLAVLSLAVLAGLIYFEPYRMARFTGFLNPWQTQFTEGYQLINSLIAIGRGGFAGVGVGESIQKLHYLPEAHTDFIFAVWSEESGFIGVILMIALYGVIGWRGLAIAQAAKTAGAMFASSLAYGISIWLTLQAFINMAVNMGLLPTKGLTLPLLSYGGSSLVVTMVSLAILLRIHAENETGTREVRRG